MAKVWIFQREDRGNAYCVGWYDPKGKRKHQLCGPGFLGKKNAEKLAKKIEAQLLEGTYSQVEPVTWKKFREEYVEIELASKSPGTQRETIAAMNTFERIVKPVKMVAVDTMAVDKFRSVRRKERGKKPGTLVSPSTVNKELRHLRAVFHQAVKWKFLTEVPDFTFELETEPLPKYMTPDHFQAIYQASEKAQFPTGLPCEPSDWWKGFLVFAWLTGWRVGEILKLKKTDIAEGMAVLSNQKGRKKTLTPLHPMVLNHLDRIISFSPLVFPWNQSKRTLHENFHKLQLEAGIHLPCQGEHQHTPACHLYGFHAIRKSFATMNSGNLTPELLQSFMRHQSFQTTMKYYTNPLEGMKKAVGLLHIPDFLKTDQEE